MKAVLVASILVASVMGVASNASAEYGTVKGNDTGGIIPWSCEAEAVARDIAGNHCGFYGKYPRITSVHRHYGDYIAFSCPWTPYIGPYQLPAVSTHNACKALPHRRIVQPGDWGAVDGR